MSTIKFLCASTDAPRAASEKRVKMPVPHPQMDEYRVYYNHREVEVLPEANAGDPDETTGEVDALSQSPQLVPTADYVSVQADHEPTDEEWSKVLSEQGFTEEQISAILNND